MFDANAILAECSQPWSVTADAFRARLRVRAGERAYVSGDGTSLAAAVVAGGAALLLQAVPELSPGELEEVLRVSARDVPPDGPDPATGAGALDLVAALRSGLDDDEAGVRVAAIEGVVLAGDAGATEALGQMARRDMSPVVRTRAREAFDALTR